MHHLDLGLFNYQVTYTRVLLKKLCGQIAVDELDNHLAKILRFPGLKIFKNSLENIKRFIANEFWNMIKNLIKQWAKSFIKLFKEYSLSELQLPKLHNWCYHIIKTIREYGAINSGNYIRAKSLYYNELSFSDVSISMSEKESEDYNTAEGGACFGKVLMLINIKIIEKDLLFDLAFVQWYDFCNSRQLYKYDCLWLKIINTYNFVPIESI
ncbi:hypothetical protein RhiirA1_397206 [Rhizophagus irregularis]|uniref:Uncharacterized protein n=1 Tax=Rhizophagus irregularis TaxID=588596 RepID=A0A2N0RI57_9GLOM|nr:hypothetical protein RhiirA1_397206 [Rhizophagus irregularis]